jgi:hypothetical protein
VPASPQAKAEALTVVARTGYAARGIIYEIVGIAIALAAFQPQQRPLGAVGALKAVVREPLGGAIVLAIAAGLACLALSLALGALRQGVRGGRVRRWLVHAGMLGDAILYAGFAFVVVGAVFGWGGGAGARRGWTAWLIASPGGRVLAGLIGLVVAAGGIAFIVWAWVGDIEHELDLPARQKRWTAPFARCGLTGRGAAIAVVGGFLLAAAFDADPTEAHGLGGALNSLRATRYGGVVLALFAVSFGAAGFYDFLQARYRRVR